MKNGLGTIDKKNELRNNIKAQLIPLFSILTTLFLIFFPLYSKKTEVELKINPENINIEEQKLYPKDVSPEQLNESETQEGVNEKKNSENGKEISNIEAPQGNNAATDAVKKEAPRTGLVIGIIADAHSGQEYAFARLNSATWGMKNYFAPDIVVDLGDLIESRFHYKAIKKSAAIEDYKRASYLISRYFPVYHAIGNHEIMSLSKADVQNLTGRKNYYSVKVRGYNIIILDANYAKDEKDINAKHPDDFLFDGTLPEKELEWLEDQVEKNTNNIIFIHHPLRELTNRGDVEEVIRDNKQRIIMIANGHKHPKVLGISTFGGVKNYEIPSVQFRKSYTAVKINGTQATVTSRKIY